MTPRCASVFTDTDKRAHRCERPAEHCDWDVDRYGHTLHRQGNTSWQTRAENVVETALWTPADGYPRGTATAYPVGLERYASDPLAPPIPEDLPEQTHTFTVPMDLTERFIGVHGGSTPGVRALGVTANDLANLMLTQLPEDWPILPDTESDDHPIERYLIAGYPGEVCGTCMRPIENVRVDHGGTPVGGYWQHVPSSRPVTPVLPAEDAMEVELPVQAWSREVIEALYGRPVVTHREVIAEQPTPQDTPPEEPEHESATPIRDTPDPATLDWATMVDMARHVRGVLDKAMERALDPRPFGMPPTWTPDQTDRLLAMAKRRGKGDATMPRVAGWRAAWRARR